jgi:hypothetical protein
MLETKNKILGWLKEEAAAPEEINDPAMYFNIRFRTGPILLNAFQPGTMDDSFLILGSTSLTDEQAEVVYKNVVEEKHETYIADLKLMLLANNELGDYEMKLDAQNHLREVRIYSRKIYYDSLTKEKLVLCSRAVVKAITSSHVLFEKYLGKIPSLTNRS